MRSPGGFAFGGLLPLAGTRVIRLSSMTAGKAVETRSGTSHAEVWIPLIRSTGRSKRRQFRGNGFYPTVICGSTAKARSQVVRALNPDIVGTRRV
jgi:hypothetical protein